MSSVKVRMPTRRVFAARISRGVVWGLGIIGFALFVGMVGYKALGPMGWAQAFANASMILSGMGPLDKLDGTAGLLFEGAYALVCGLVFFAVAGLVLAPIFHRILVSFHIEDVGEQP